MNDIKVRNLFLKVEGYLILIFLAGSWKRLARISAGKLKTSYFKG
jgi:hypothetical protein